MVLHTTEVLPEPLSQLPRAALSPAVFPPASPHIPVPSDSLGRGSPVL